MEQVIADTYKYKSTDLACLIVALANDKCISINITKLQKLLYITYGTYLCVYGERLVDEPPQAWPYGPVFPTTRARLVNEDLSHLQVAEGKKEALEEMRNDERLQKVLGFVFDNFGTWNAGQLSEWSHAKGSPWDRTRSRNGFMWGNVIPDTFILEYFDTIIIVKS